MTTAQLLATVRSILDEVTEAFWKDSEIYQALTDGQMAVITSILETYKLKVKLNSSQELPYELSVLSVDTGGLTIAASYISVPTGFLYLVNAAWDHDATGGEKPCYIISQDRNFGFREDNTYAKATASAPVAYLSTVGGVLKINFLPAYSTSATYSINYLKTPSDIALGVEPKLPASTHTSIIHYAVARQLFKDGRANEANLHYQLFLSEIQNLIKG